MEDRFAKVGLTFDDVMLVPARADAPPKEVDVSARLTDKIRLAIPICSAAMDTVTESKMAIAIAREGGIGFIHKNLDIETQAAEVDKVKRSESGMISHPVTLSADKTVGDAMEMMSHFRISGVPITDDNNVLVGILTNRDLRFERDKTRLIGDVMTKAPLVTGPEGTTLEQAQKLLHEHRIEKLPIVDNSNKLVGLITVKDIEKKIRYPSAAKDERGRLLCGAALGFEETLIDRAGALVEAGVDILVLDSAHGHSKGILESLPKLKRNFPKIPVVAGNVVTPEATTDLIEAGADVIKVGIGPGSICTTRVVSGCGMPQITAISDCAAVCKERNVALIADGGIRLSGDITKAIAAGADIVMIGGLFAGTEESPGETVLLEGRTFKIYRGMGSVGAMAGGKGSRYEQGHVVEASKLVPEGIEGRVAYRGSLAGNVYQLVGGLKAGMFYAGAQNLDQLRRAKFVQITRASVDESHPHDVTITHEAPNYRLSDR